MATGDVETAARADPETGRPARHATELESSFRSAMRRVAATVALVTTRDAQGCPHGVAASSVIPVSMDPPSMLVAVNRGASIHLPLSAVRRFCVNVLGSGQHELLARFSQSALRDQRFAGNDWQQGPRELPWLASAPAAVFCEVEQSIDYGTHTIFIGRVHDIVFGSDAEPMVWLGGAARRT